jgi:hypothetical protein
MKLTNGALSMKTQTLFAMIGCISVSFATTPDHSNGAQDHHSSKESTAGKHKKKHGKHCKHTSYQTVTSKIADDLNAGKPVDAGLYTKAETERKKCCKKSCDTPKHDNKDHHEGAAHDAAAHADHAKTDEHKAAEPVKTEEVKA